MGLDVPSVCKLILKLWAMGIDCAPDIFREEQAVSALLDLWKGGAAHGAE